MFSRAHREEVAERLLDRARADERVVGAARTGSAARGTQDRWSDIDLFLGIAEQVPLEEVLAAFTSWLYADLGAVHHFDLHAGPATYRAFLLADGLEVDLGLTPAHGFGPMGGGAFEVIFGQPIPPAGSALDASQVVGLGWHHALHARTAIARVAPWQAEHWISALRDHTITLACVRHGLPAAYGKGADQLPKEEQAALRAALVTGLDQEALTRALASTVQVFLTEADHADPAAADRLRLVLADLTGSGS